MAKQISKGQALGGFISDLDESIAKIGSLDTAIHALDSTLKVLQSDAGKLRKEIGGIDVSNVKGIKELNAKQQEANKIKLDSIRIEQQQQKLLIDKERLTQAMIRTEKLKNQESKKTLTAYQQESRALTEMRNRYKDLAVQKMNGIKLTKEEEKEYRRLIPQIRQTDQALKKIDATGGQFGRKVGEYPKVINGFRNALGELGVAFGVFQAVGAGGKALIEFENSVASFRTIVSDLNDNEFEKYKSQIISVADQTKRSNTEIAESFEAIAGLNSEFAETADGLGEVSEAVSTLSKASKDDLSNSASNLVGIMNQFDLAADQSNRTINVLAAGQAVGASSITQSAEAYKNFGAVAKGANITLEQSQALIQVLGKSSIFGAEAGTKLRGVTLQLQKANLGYASGQFNINDALAEFNEKLATKTSASAKDAYATKVFGAENITAGKIVSSNIPLFEKFTEAVTDTTEAQKAAEINSNTLSNRWEEFKNVLENTITSSTSTNGALGGLKDTLKFLAENIDTVLTVAKEALTVFAIYKSRIIALNVAQKLFGDGAGKLNVSLKQLVSNTKDATGASTKFGYALKGIGWTAVIALAVELGKELYNVASGAMMAELNVQRMNKALEKTLKEGGKISASIINQIKDRLKADNQEIDLLKISDKEKNKLRASATYRARKEIKENIDIAKSLYLKFNALRLEATETRDRQKRNINFLTMSDAEAKAYALSEVAVTNYTSRQKEAKLILDNLRGTYIELGDASHDLNVEQQGIIASTGKHGKAVKELNTQLKEQNEYLSRQIDLLYEINNISRDLEIDAQNDRIEQARNEALRQMELTGQPSGNLGKIKDLIDARSDMEKQAVEAELQNRIQTLNDQYLQEKLLAKKALDDERYELLNQKNITNDAKLAIEKDYQEKLRKLDEYNFKRSDDLTLEIEKAKLESSGKLIEIEKKKNDEIIATTEELNAKQEEFAENANKVSEESAKKNYDNERKYIELTTKIFEDQIDKRITKLNELTEASKKEQQNLQELANSGNIKAQQSIAREAEIQREAEKEKAKLEQRKLYLQAFSAFMTDYTNRLEKGEDSTQALAGAIADKAVLEAILSTLPAFFDGADKLDASGRGIDGRGGFLAINHPDERVVPKKENDQLTLNGKPIPNDMLPSIVSQWKAGIGLNMMDVKTVEKSSDQQIIQKLDELTNVIKSKPDRYPEFEQVVKGVFNLYFNETKGNKTTRTINQYRNRS